MGNDVLLQIAGILVTGGAIYGAIRSDIRNIHESIKDSRESITRAHDRIDNILTGARK
jgi:hypothetical protein